MVTREQWLTEAIEDLRDGLFKQCGASIPNVRVSVGFPGGSRGSAKKAIGQYWHAHAIEDGIPQIFISPVLCDSQDVLGTLVHELVHACTPGAGHKGPFKTLALKVGLRGKMTATTESDELKAHLDELAKKLGPYPHGKINLDSRKKQTTRMGKCACEICGYTVRVSRKWLDMGAPICPVDGVEMNQE